MFDTVSDPWRPRSEAWLARAPSRFEGRPGRPLLIGGCPRSGTTLLRGLLNNHWDLAIPGETNFVYYLLRHRAEFGSMRRAENRLGVAEWLLDSEGRGAKRIKGESAREEVLARAERAGPTMGSVIAALFGLYAERHGAQRWGDKRPGYAGYIPWLFQLFPDAQFVNVIRDPRGAAASQVPLGWEEDDVALPSGLITWLTAVARVDAHSRRLRPDQLLDVRFEDLVRDPPGTLKRILQFAGLRHGDNLIDGMLTRRIRGEFRPGWHDRLQGEVDPSVVDHWRERLAPQEVALVEHVAGGHFERFGYRPLEGLGAAPDPAQLDEIERQRRRRLVKWRQRRREIFKQRLLTLGAPLAARPTGPPAAPRTAGRSTARAAR